jgi:3-oxoacyl-[acyl-carrier-protein] synthase II
VATVLAVKHDIIPPTINLDDPDDDLRVDVPDKARETPVPAALNDSFGFGGHNVALLFRKT